MPKIIASTYEILEEIGSGGGGIVYLGRHLRLNKKIVLKADKRNLTANPEHLRREVDALKNLSHTYIPQVYDFVQQDGVVYSVMDYIEGESLDRPLKRNERFKQSQVVEWACELLEALEYLHSYPPYGILHGDIKPANIMLTPQGDIRLIDFNIALALGEKGAVRVGYSQGYASPEHYGLNYTGMGETLRTREVPATRPTRRRTAPGERPPAPGTGSSSGEVEPTELLRGKDQATERTEPLAGSGQVTEGTELLGRGGDGGQFKGEEKQEGRKAVPLEAAEPRDTSREQGVLLDARSDIYSLGATLYHLLTGHCAPPDAREVRFIRDRDVSQAVAEIIYKAMAPDPDQRWQSAAEMRRAFESLHENDPRVLRHRRLVRSVSLFLIALFLTGGICTFTGLKQMERQEERERIAAETARRAVEAVSGAENAFRAGDQPGAIRLAVEALELDAPNAAQAQSVLTDALGVYDLSDGFRSSCTLPLSAAPWKTALSPAGTRAAAIADGRLTVFDTETGQELASLETEASALADAVFLEENTVLYAGKGALRAYDLEAGQELWSGGAATSIAVSADGTTVAAVYRDESAATLYDGRTGEAKGTVSFGDRRQRVVPNDVFADPEDNLLALNGTGTLLAVSDSQGGLQVFDLLDDAASLTIFEQSDYVHFEGGFCGKYLAFSATGESGSVFAVIDMELTEQTGGFQSQLPFHVLADETGVFVSTENLLVSLNPLTGEQRELAYAGADISAFARGDGRTLVALADGTAAFYDETAAQRTSLEVPCDFLALAGDIALTGNRDTPSLRVLRLETHPASFTYHGDYPHSEARVSQSGQVTLFQYDGFRVYKPDGTIAAEMAIPESAQVVDQQYRREESGDVLEVIYNNGTVRRYAVEDGSLLSEEMGPPPDRTLDEEFLTDRLQITAPLHGTPVAYDRESGERIRELEREDYLAYVTQVENYVITEYITSQGERYGLLLNEDCETLARLPDLCDILPDSTLVFDDMKGNLRQSRIYSKQELMDLAKNYLGGNRA